MGLHFFDLDEATRQHLLAEIDGDAAGTGFYVSNYLTIQGAEQWPGLLREACRAGNDDTLARSLEMARAFKAQVERRKPKGGFTLVAVPATAAQTLSESQFNMYYMRALAIRAIAEGKRLLVYRGKAVANPRPESEQMIGTYLDPQKVLDVLRQTKGVEPEIGIPMPNSGLCIRLA